MPDIELTSHAIDMIAERNIAEEWLWRAVNTPDRKRLGDDGNMHYTCPYKPLSAHNWKSRMSAEYLDFYLPGCP